MYFVILVFFRIFTGGTTEVAKLHEMTIQPQPPRKNRVFGMAAIPFLCNGTLLFQGNLPWVLPVIIYKYASCLILYIVSFLILCGEWSSLVFKDFKKYFCFKVNVFIFCLVRLHFSHRMYQNDILKGAMKAPILS